MTDQADRLRQITNDMKLNQVKKQTEQSEKAVHNARIITVTSGKGGVGKSNITVNLAISLSEMGQRVIILDADFGLSNIDILFGITPEYTLADVVYGRKNILQILSNGPNNIRFISGGSGVEELVKLQKNSLDRFIEHIKLLDKLCDIILVDTGAGLSDNVMSFAVAADEVLLIVTPEPTSITDAYALVKMMSNQGRDKNIKLIVNRAESVNEALEILNRLYVVARKFLNINLVPLGYIRLDEKVIKAVKIQQPFYQSFPKCLASRNIKEISCKLLDMDKSIYNYEVNGVKGFFSKLVNFVNG